MYGSDPAERKEKNMFIAEYSHSKSYFDFEVSAQLPEEGMLRGHDGELRFKRMPILHFAVSE